MYVPVPLSKTNTGADLPASNLTGMDIVEPFDVAYTQPLFCPDYATVAEDALEHWVGHRHPIYAMTSIGMKIIVGMGIVKRADVRHLDGQYFLHLVLEVGPDIAPFALDAVRTLPSA